MAHIHISLAPSRALYEQVSEHVDLAALQEDGLLLHSASELASGEVRIVDVWTDGAAVEKGRARMLATFEDLGVAPMVQGGPAPEVSEAFHFVQGGAR